MIIGLLEKIGITFPKPTANKSRRDMDQNRRKQSKRSCEEQ